MFETAKQNDCRVKFTSVYFSSVERVYRQIFGIPPWLARNSFSFNVRAVWQKYLSKNQIDELKINNNLTSQEFARKNINFLDKRHFQNTRIYLFLFDVLNTTYIGTIILRNDIFEIIFAKKWDKYSYEFLNLKLQRIL